MTACLGGGGELLHGCLGEEGGQEGRPRHACLGWSRALAFYKKILDDIFGLCPTKGNTGPPSFEKKF